MNLRFLLSILVFFLPYTTHASDRFLLNFEMAYPDGQFDKGRTFSYSKPVTWSNGLKKSYVKLSCKQKKSGKFERLYSTVDYFSGLRVNHKIVDNNLEIQVFHQTVKPRLEEIRKLPLNECKEMLPIVYSIIENYRFPAVDGLNEGRPFGTDMTFRVKLMVLGKRR